MFELLIFIPKFFFFMILGIFIILFLKILPFLHWILLGIILTVIGYKWWKHRRNRVDVVRVNVEDFMGDKK